MYLNYGKFRTPGWRRIFSLLEKNVVRPLSIPICWHTFACYHIGVVHKETNQCTMTYSSSDDGIGVCVVIEEDGLWVRTYVTEKQQIFAVP